MLNVLTETLQRTLIVAGILIAMLSAASVVYGQDIIVEWVALTKTAGIEGSKYQKPIKYRNNNYILFGGDQYPSKMWYTSNGTTWQSITPTGINPANDGAAVATLGDIIYVVGGQYGDTGPSKSVWRGSSPGIFTLLTDDAPFGYTKEAQLLEFNNELYLISGRNLYTSTDKKEVWKTSNGVDWTAVTLNAEFPGRAYFGAYVHDGKMWIMGGNNGVDFLNDIWVSSDGAQWTQVINYSGSRWSPRDAFAFVVWQGNMWVIGGDTIDVPHSKEVWRSVDGQSWYQEKDLDRPLFGSAAFTTSGGTIFYAGGDESGALFSQEVYMVQSYIPVPTASPTPSRTPMAPPTATFTRTLTPTPTASPTRSATGTSTNTPTASPTLTPLPTDTATPTVTPTAEDTATITETHTSTNTPTITPTYEDTLTPTLTSTLTPVETPYIAYVAQGPMPWGPHVKLEWRKLVTDNPVEYKLYYSEILKGITWVESLTDADNLANSRTEPERFIYVLRDLITTTAYKVWLAFTHEGTTYTSSSINLTLVTTPTPEPTP